jgi:acetyl-CoA carboxylase carboxyl transferase subunit alpha
MDEEKKYSDWKIARHPDRPVFEDYKNNIIRDFREFYGGGFGNDPTIVCGFGKIGRDKYMIIGQNRRVEYDLKENTREEAEEKMRCFAGCPNPEGYRKALSKMKLAEKMGIPILTFIDTPGAYPGIHAEENGQSEAIAQNLKYMAMLKVPLISVLIGEGGSGGALALCGGANKFSALENACYSVISPEGCAGILRISPEEAAKCLKVKAREAYELGAIDDIIEEPLEGAHENPRDTFVNVQGYISTAMRELEDLNAQEIVEQRFRMIDRRASGEKRV